MSVHEPTPGVDAERALRGLRRYVEQVSRAVGIGPGGVWCELAEETGAYLPLDAPISELAGREVALVWNEHRGWAVGVETGPGEGLLIVAWYGQELLPLPQAVARFTATVLTGLANPRLPPTPSPPMVPAAQRESLRARLGDYREG